MNRDNRLGEIIQIQKLVDTIANVYFQVRKREEILILYVFHNTYYICNMKTEKEIEGLLSFKLFYTEKNQLPTL